MDKTIPSAATITRTKKHITEIKKTVLCDLNKPNTPNTPATIIRIPKPIPYHQDQTAPTTAKRPKIIVTIHTI